jgi:hypothetical protein
VIRDKKRNTHHVFAETPKKANSKRYQPLFQGVLPMLKRFITLILLAWLATACNQTTATTDPPAVADNTIPEINIDVSETGFAVPDVVPGGIVSINLNNTGNQPHMVNLWRVKAGHTSAEILEMSQYLRENPDDFFGIFDLGSWIHFAEGIEPSDTYHFYADLGTGEFFLQDDTNPTLDPTFFKATELVGKTAPKTDVTIDMVDFAYTMPDQISAGKKWWEITNSGDQWHMFAIIEADPSLSPEQLLAGLGGENEPPPADSPVNVVGGMPPMSPGERVWLEIDLQPNNYELFCPLPDVAAMMNGGEPLPHLFHGMRHTFVAAN